MAKATMTSDKIAGLFAEAAIDHIQSGNDQIAKQNLKTLGWASLFLSERRISWLEDQYRKDSRKGAYPTNGDVRGILVGTWEVKEVHGNPKIYFNLSEQFVSGLATR